MKEAPDEEKSDKLADGEYAEDWNDEVSTSGYLINSSSISIDLQPQALPKPLRALVLILCT